MAHLGIKNLRAHRIGPLTLSVEKGECVAVSGPSGAGKTLLLRSIADLEPHEGEAILDGVRSSDVPAPEWRRKAGMLASESHWWRDTVGEHFNAVPSDDFGRLGLTPSVMGWRVNRLSTGEEQ